MIRKPVKSSNIVSIGYNIQEKILEIEFISSGIYRYFEVPIEIYDSFLKSSSKGKFVHKNIRGRYRYENI